MSSAVQCYINFGAVDSKDWVLMAHWGGVYSTGGTQQNINNQGEKDHVGKDIPWKGAAYDLNGSFTYSYFSSYQAYNNRGSAFSGTASGGNKGGYRFFIGYPGGMGWYNTCQNVCSWNNNSGMVGAGYDGSCGTYPGSLRFGTGSGGAYMGSNHSGNVKIWIWMDNKQPIA